MRFVALMVLTVWGTIVDGVAISVGNKAITLSEVTLRIRLTAFENGEKPVFDSGSRKRAAQQLVDQKLVEREMDIGRYPRLDADRRQSLLSDYARSDRTALDRALMASSLTPADLEEDLARQADLLTFLNLRFRPAVQGAGSADADLEAWLRDQRNRIRIEYLDKDLQQ